MDFIESLGKQISEITAYDVKSYYDKAKNMVMNYTEMEAKVREATNDDAWGASSSLMQDIAQGTFNFQLFNEIMPVIYKRFTEKEAREWRQIYKSLQLLEYLVKHGSERVVDDARSHLSMIKMLRNFHYIDDKGKDQGINVRNRSKELSELLQDLDRVRQERRKAKQNKSKYTGVGNDGFSSGGFSGGGGPSFTSPTGSRYGGFGSDQVYGGSSAGGSSYPDTYPSSSRSNRRDSFEEYDAGGDEVRDGAGTRSPTMTAPTPVKKDTPVIKQKAKEVNLFDFDDDDTTTSAAVAPASAAAPPSASFNSLSLDDDFDDFQSAGAPTSAAALAPTTTNKPSQQQGGLNFFDMTSSNTMSAAPARPATMSPPLATTSTMQPQIRTSQHMPAGPNYSNLANNTTAGPGAPPHASSFSGITPSSASQTSSAKSAGAFDFDDLFAASGAKKTNASSAGAAKNSMANLAQQKQSSSLWGSTTNNNNSSGGGSNSDLLF